MYKRNFPNSLYFPVLMSIAIVVATVVVIALIMFFVTWCQGKTLETVPMLICGVTMLVAGCSSLFVTCKTRNNKRFFAVSGLIGVTTIMIVPLLVVVVIHVFSAKSTAHLVFSYFVVYYLLFLPVGTWLILPPKNQQANDMTEDPPL